MGWARLDDGYANHPKLMSAGLEATGLDARAISHCAKYETDGFVGDSEVASLAGDTRKGRKLAQVLEGARRWHRTGSPCECLPDHATTDRRPGYWVHDFLKYNSSKAKLAAIRAADRDRKGNSLDSAQNPPGNKPESGGNPNDASRASGRARASRPPPVLTTNESSSSPTSVTPPVEDEDNAVSSYDVCLMAANLRLKHTTVPVRFTEKWLVGTADRISIEHGEVIKQRLIQGEAPATIAAHYGPVLPKTNEPKPAYHAQAGSVQPVEHIENEDGTVVIAR